MYSIWGWLRSYKASLPPPPISGTVRHGTKQGGTRRFRPPPSLCLLHM